MKETATACALCGGQKKDGFTTFTVDLKDTLVVIRNVPATVCSLCGNEWLKDDTAEAIERIVDDARRHHRSVEVTQFHIGL